MYSNQKFPWMTRLSGLFAALAWLGAVVIVIGTAIVWS
jgi:hypothetical protein